MHLPDDKPIFDLHPDYLRVLSILFGLPKPKAPDKANITVLGVSHGGNLLSLAAEYPQAKFTAVFKQPSDLEKLTQACEHLELKNIVFVSEAQWLTEPSKTPADYILSHGYYSYLDDATKQQVNQTILNKLHPNGIAYINYLVEPGWQSFATLQHLLKQTTDDHAWQDEATFNNGVNLIYKHLPDDSPLKSILKHIVPEMNLRTHPSLHGYWALKPAHAETVDVFLERLHEHELGYVCDTDVSRYYFRTLPPALDEFSGANFHRRENLYDIYYQRSSRASMVVHIENLVHFHLPHPEAMLQRLEQLHISGDFQLSEDKTVWISTLNPNISISATAFNSMVLKSLSVVFAKNHTLSVSKLLESINQKFQKLENIEHHARILLLDLILSGAVYARSQRQTGFHHLPQMLALHQWRMQHDAYLTPADKWFLPLSEEVLQQLENEMANTP